jgi:hypothetical protein
VEPAISPQQSSWADRVRKVSVGSLSTTSSAPPLKSPTSQPENAQQQRSVAGISAYQCGYKANSGYNSPDSDNWKLDLERRGDAILSDLSETAFSEVYQTPERDDCGEYNAGSGGIAVSVTPRNRRPSRSGDLTKISPESDNLFPLPGSSGSSMAMPTRYFGGGNNSIFGSADLAISGSHHTANGRDIFGISLPLQRFPPFQLRSRAFRMANTCDHSISSNRL